MERSRCSQSPRLGMRYRKTLMPIIVKTGSANRTSCGSTRCIVVNKRVYWNLRSDVAAPVSNNEMLIIQSSNNYFCLFSTTPPAPHQKRGMVHYFIFIFISDRPLL